MTLDKIIVIVLVALALGSLVWVRLHSSRSGKENAGTNPKEKLSSGDNRVREQE